MKAKVISSAEDLRMKRVTRKTRLLRDAYRSCVGQPRPLKNHQEHTVQMAERRLMNSLHEAGFQPLPRYPVPKTGKWYEVFCDTRKPTTVLYVDGKRVEAGGLA